MEEDLETIPQTPTEIDADYLAKYHKNYYFYLLKDVHLNNNTENIVWPKNLLIKEINPVLFTSLQFQSWLFEIRLYPKGGLVGEQVLLTFEELINLCEIKNKEEVDQLELISLLED